MNALMYALFICLFTLDWLAFKLQVAGRIVTWMPELLSLIAMCAVLLIAAKQRRLPLGLRYGVFLALFLTLVVGWAMVSGVASGVILAGMRNYLKYLPFFLLPIIYAFSEKQIRRQLMFLAVLSMVQLPVVVYQRFVEFAGLRTGDVIGGTLGLNTSGVLSVLLACAITATVAFYVKGRIRLLTLIILVPVLATPMMLNETKISLLLIPAAVMGPIILGGKIDGGLKKSLTLTVIGIVVGVAYLQMYEKLRGTSVIDFFTNTEKVESYAYSGENPQLYDTVNRLDSIHHAISRINRDGNILLGVGAGNASDSFSDKLKGEYYKKYYYLAPGMVYLSKVLWELGVVGVLLFGAFFTLIALDSYHLRWQPDLVGSLALAWVIITGFMAASFVYFKTFDINLFGYLYWYFSGYIVAESYRVRIERRSLLQAGEELVPG